MAAMRTLARYEPSIDHRLRNEGHQRLFITSAPGTTQNITNSAISWRRRSQRECPRRTDTRSKANLRLTL